MIDEDQAIRGITQSLRMAANQIDKQQYNVAQVITENALISLKCLIKEARDSNGIMEEI